MPDIEFNNPIWFAALPAVLLLFWSARGKRTAAVRFSNTDLLRTGYASLRTKLRFLPMFLRILAVMLIIFALARPRKGLGTTNISTEAVAIQLVVDRSGSMREKMTYKGRRLNRLDVVKEVLRDFITGGSGMEGRTGDLLGLITFARYADTLCPLVQADDVIAEFLSRTEIVTDRNEDGTAIGDAVALAAARLETAEKEIQKRNQRLQSLGWEAGEDIQEPDFEIKSKVIILLTDGRNNQGERSPMEAAQIAKDRDIKIYAIGIGSKQQGGDIFTLLSRSGLDEQLLNAMAENTGGFYARADDGEQLVNIYRKINELEKSRIKSIRYTHYSELFTGWALGALALLIAETILSNTYLRKIP